MLKKLKGRIKNSNFFRIMELQIKVFNLESEIKKQKDINADLRAEHEDYLILRNNALEFSKEIISLIHDIKVVNEWNILEYDKKQRINNLTKSINKKCTKFITKNELDALTQHLIQK